MSFPSHKAKPPICHCFQYLVIILNYAAIALGSSVVKVSGRFAFRLSLVLGADPSWAAADRLGLPKGSVFSEPSTKVSLRFHQGFTEVPLRFHQGCKFRSFGADPFWGSKMFCGRSPITSLSLSSISSTLFCIFRLEH